MSEKAVYWSAILCLFCICLAILFVVSFVLGFILVEKLYNISMGGYKVGFWFALQ